MISRASQSPAIYSASGWANQSPAAQADDLTEWGGGGDDGWPGGGADDASAYAYGAPSPAAAVVPPPPPPAPPPMQAPAISTQSHGSTAGWMSWGRDAIAKVTTAATAAAAASALPPPPPPPIPASVQSSALPLAAAAPPKDRPVMSPQQRTDHLRSLLTHPSSGHAKSAPPQAHQQASVHPSAPAPMDKRQQAMLYQQAAAAIGRQLPQHQREMSLVQQQKMQAQQQQQQVLQARMTRHQQQQQQQQQHHQQQHQQHQQHQQQYGGGNRSSRASGHAAAPQMQQSDSWGSSGWTNAGYSDWADPIPEEDEEEYDEDEDGDYEEEDEEGYDDGGWETSGGGEWGASAQDEGGWGAQKQDNSGWGKQNTQNTQPQSQAWGAADQGAGWGQSAQSAASGYTPRVRFSPTVSYQTDYPGSRAPPAPAAPPAPGPAPTSFHPSAVAHSQTHRHPPPSPAQAASSAYHPSAWGAGTLPSPSKTLAMASGAPDHLQTTVFELQPPRNGLGENAFATSRGHALIPAERALFSRSRPAKQRIRWSFNPDKDPRVSSLLKWVHAMANGLATIGVSAPCLPLRTVRPAY